MNFRTTKIISLLGFTFASLCAQAESDWGMNIELALSRAVFDDQVLVVRVRLNFDQGRVNRLQAPNGDDQRSARCVSDGNAVAGCSWLHRRGYRAHFR